MIRFVVVLVLMAMVGTFFTFALLYFKKGMGKNFYHNVLHWHTPSDGPKTIDECRTGAVCKYCGKKIIMDSQGNWF